MHFIKIVLDLRTLYDLSTNFNNNPRIKYTYINQTYINTGIRSVPIVLTVKLASI